MGIRFIGVCIPWRDAHVRTGRRDRKPWEDHLNYCHGLSKIIEKYKNQNTPICVLGDFNQRIPRHRQPIEVEQALINAIPANYNILTKGLKDSEGKLLIDHIVLSPGLNSNTCNIIPRFSLDGTKLSDHVGIEVE